MQLNIHQRYLIEEFAEEYLEHRLSRRDLLRRTLLITASVPFSASVLLSLGCGPESREDEAAPTSGTSGAETPRATGATSATPASSAGAATTPGVSASDPAIEAGDVRFRGPASELLAYAAHPRGQERAPGILVIHENRGLVDHTKDVARRYAKEGFAALAIDLVSRRGGTKPASNENTGFLGSARPEDLVADLGAGLAYLKAQPYVRADALGVTGFCFGGGYTWETAIANPELKAAVPYYGTAPLDRLGQIEAAVLAIYGENDRRITAQAPEVEQRLRDAGATVEVKVYPGVGHAFFNDTGGSYNAQAAADAWTVTLAWFRRHLV